MMIAGQDALRLRIFVHEALQHDHHPLYEHIVHLAMREGLAGATVFRGIEGFGLHRHIHTNRLVEVSDDLPVIIEIIDRPEAVQRFLAHLDGVIIHGRVTVTPVHMYDYRRRRT